MPEPPARRIPQNVLTPFDCWNLPDEENRAFLYPELDILVGGLTLITGYCVSLYESELGETVIFAFRQLS